MELDGTFARQGWQSTKYVKSAQQADPIRYGFARHRHICSGSAPERPVQQPWISRRESSLVSHFAVKHGYVS